MDGEFYVGSFYGLTAPLALLINRGDLNGVINKVNSREGLINLNNLRIELMHLRNVLTDGKTVLTVEDYSKQFELIGKMIGLKSEAEYRRFVVGCKKYYNGGIGRKPEVSEEDWRIIEKEIEKVDRTLTGMVRDKDGNTVTLSKEAKILLERLYSRAVQTDNEGVRNIDKIIDKIDDVQKSKFSESQLFLGYKLYKILNTVNLTMQNNLINESYYRGLEGLTIPAQKYELENRLKDCEFLLKLADVKEEESREKEKVDLSYSEDKWECVKRSCDVSESNRELWERIEGSSVERSVLEDVEVFREIVKFNAMIELYQKEYFNNMFNKELTEEELQEVFRELEDIGIIGLTVNVKEFFIYGVKRGMYLGEFNQGRVLEKDSTVYQNIMLLYRDIRSKLSRYEIEDEEGVVIL